MKTLKVLSAAAFILTVSCSLAQEAQPSGDYRDILQFGIKAGFNNSNLYDTKGPTVMNNPIFGPVFGGFLSIPIGTYLGVQPEVLYSAKGYSGTGTTAEGQYYSFTDRMNFLDVPVMLQFKPFSNLYLLGGPEYSYLLSRDYIFNEGLTSTTTQQQFDNDNIRHNIFGLIFGADVNLNKFTLGGRIAWDEQYNNGDGTSSLPRYRNYWGQLTLGFRF